MNKILFSLLFIICFVLNVNSQKLTKIELKIIEKVKATHEESIDFLEKVVNINSGSLNPKGVRKVGNVFSNAFDDIGFDTRWIDMPKEMNRAGHLFASIKGKKGKKLLLIGHLDTVFEENSPFQSFIRQDSIAFGPGANDMKGGNVVILYALKALNELNLLRNASITIAFIGDEESTGKPLSISRKDLIEAGKEADIALGYENASGFDYATIARRGASGWTVETQGVRAHSSSIFNEQVGAGAIFEMSRILNSFYEEVRGEEYLTFNPGTLLGGTFVNYNMKKSSGEVFGKSNVVAQKAIVSGGLRFISEEQKENTRSKMRKIVAQNLPQTTASISFNDRYPAMKPTEGNLALLAELDQVSKDLGQGGVKPYDPLKRGAADISFVADFTDGIDGLGTMGDGAHTPQETVNLNTMNALIQRSAILIYRLTR
ncbi:MAG: M20/M25/M40 family metallo-hydrolase [Flavobacteriaceae bacterium]